MAKFTSKTLSDEVAIEAVSGGEAIHGESNHPAVAAIAGFQVHTTSTGAGIYGENRGGGPGVVGINDVKTAGSGGPGASFHSELKEGIFAATKSVDKNAVHAVLDNPAGTGAAIYGEHIKGGLAARFVGNVEVSGDISFPGADFAEDFTVGGVAVEPGTVMAISEAGTVVPCDTPYDSRVVGVIAGAGTFHSGIVMDRQPVTSDRRQPIALVGKVYCKVDATQAPIRVGDLLTSSSTSGHAMRAVDPRRAFGAVIGKAMAPLSGGTGMIPILISLQ